MSLVGFSRFPLGYGDKTKVLWKPLLTQNPAMGLLEFSAQWESGEPHQAHGLHNLYWVAYTTYIGWLTQPKTGSVHQLKFRTIQKSNKSAPVTSWKKSHTE